jgi:hypothetical protein
MIRTTDNPIHFITASGKKNSNGRASYVNVYPAYRPNETSNFYDTCYEGYDPRGHIMATRRWILFRILKICTVATFQERSQICLTL